MSRSNLCVVLCVVVGLNCGIQFTSGITTNYVVGTLPKERDGWSLTGPGNEAGPPQLAEFITSPANFGPTGIVTNKVFSIVELEEITPQSLSAIDIFHITFDGQGYNGNIPDLDVAEIDALIGFVNGKGRLLVFVSHPSEVTHPLAGELLTYFGISAGSYSGDGNVVPTDAMPPRMKYGPFGEILQITWSANEHSSIITDSNSPAQVLLSSLCDNKNEMAMGWFGNGMILVFGDYYDSYSSIASNQSSVGFDVLMGNVFNFINPINLSIAVEPMNIGINSTTPDVGQHQYLGEIHVDISSERFPACPDVYRFDHWLGDGIVDPNSANTQVLLNVDKTITAVFVLDEPICGDECHPNFLLGDHNHDCYVNMVDFAMFLSRWMTCTAPECN